MNRPAATCIAVVLFAGCHAPTPSFNVFAPYGSSRVPPPATGSYGASHAYYSRHASAPAEAAGAREQALAKSPAAKSDGIAMVVHQTPAEDAVAEKSAEKGIAAPEKAPAVEPAIRIVEPSTAVAAKAQISGMPFNDATLQREPARFVPPPGLTEITQLPRPAGNAAAPPLRVRGLQRSSLPVAGAAAPSLEGTSAPSPEVAKASATVSTSSGGSTSVASSDNGSTGNQPQQPSKPNPPESSNTESQWRSRYASSGPDG